MKRRNPNFGCVRIAQQLSHAFGIEIDKDVVRRMLAKHYRPERGNEGPSWLSLIGHGKDSLWSMDLFRCESILLQLLGDAGHGRIHAPTRRLRRRTRKH